MLRFGAECRRVGEAVSGNAAADIGEGGPAPAVASWRIATIRAAAASVQDGRATSSAAARLRAEKLELHERERWTTDPGCHDVSAQKTGRAYPTVAGRIAMRCMMPTGQTGQTRRERPVRSW